MFYFSYLEAEKEKEIATTVGKSGGESDGESGGLVALVRRDLIKALTSLSAKRLVGDTGGSSLGSTAAADALVQQN